MQVEIGTIILMISILLILIIGIFIYINHKKYSQIVNERLLKNLRIEVAKMKITEEEIKEKLQEEENEFLMERFDNYCTIQNAWMNFDYDTLRKYTTDELYNQYEMQLQTLQRKEEQNIMYDYTPTYYKILQIEKDNNNTIVTVEIQVNLIDYIVDKNRKIIRGSDERVLHNDYIMTFTRNNKMIENCPNCNAPLNGNNICPNCNTVIDNSQNNWVLSKKETI